MICEHIRSVAALIIAARQTGSPTPFWEMGKASIGPSSFALIWGRIGGRLGGRDQGEVLL